MKKPQAKKSNKDKLTKKAKFAKFFGKIFGIVCGFFAGVFRAPRPPKK